MAIGGHNRRCSRRKTFQFRTLFFILKLADSRRFRDQSKIIFVAVSASGIFSFGEFPKAQEGVPRKNPSAHLLCTGPTPFECTKNEAN
jgi:hypothetical protein